MPEMLLTEEELKRPLDEMAPQMLLDTEERPAAAPKRRSMLDYLGGLTTTAPVALPAAAGQELAQQLSNLERLAPLIQQATRGATGMPVVPTVKPPQIPVPQAPGRETLAGKIGGLLGGGIGYAGMGEAMGPARIAEALSPLAEQAAIGGAYGVTQAPEAPGRGALIGAGAGAGLHLVGKGLGKVAQRAMKRAEVVYPQAQAALDSMLDRLRGSSTKETSAQDIFDRASQHFEELEGRPDIETGRWVQPHESISSAYKTPATMAKAQGVKINQNPYLDKMNKAKKTEVEEAEVFGEDQDEDRLKMMNYLDKKLLAPKFDTFDKLDKAKRNLNKDIGKFAIGDPRRHLAMEAKDAIKDTLEKSLGKDTEIKDLWNEADRRYKEELLPFKKIPGGTKNKSPFYNRYAKGKPVSGMAEEYLRPSKQKDPVELLNNFMHMMPDEESKNLVAYHYLRNQEGDPGKLLAQYKKLGENQKNALFNESDKKLLDSYSKLHDKNPSLFKEPAKKTTFEKGIETTRAAGGVAGFAAGHPGVGAALLAYPHLQRLGAATGGRLAGLGERAAISPALRSLITRYLTQDRGGQ